MDSARGRSEDRSSGGSNGEKIGGSLLKYVLPISKRHLLKNVLSKVANDDEAAVNQQEEEEDVDDEKKMMYHT